MHFFIFTTKTIKVIFWKNLGLMPLFSTWMWQNGKWNCSWTRTSTCHPLCKSEKGTRTRFPISNAEVVPLICVWLSYCKAYVLCWASEARTPFKTQRLGMDSWAKAPSPQVQVSAECTCFFTLWRITGELLFHILHRFLNVLMFWCVLKLSDTCC